MDFLEDPDAYWRLVRRVARADMALALVECPGRWQPVLELGLALGLLPDRALRVVEQGGSEWEPLLRGLIRCEADEVILVRGLRSEALEGALTALNLARDDFMEPGARIWLWLPEGALARLPPLAPDLWRFRHSSLVLRPPLAAELTLPLPVPGLPWPELAGPLSRD
jgi:hypothetical protein